MPRDPYLGAMTHIAAPADGRLGRPEMEFADPGAFGWAALALGLAASLAGALMALLMAVDPPKHGLDQDAIGVIVLGVGCLVAGVGFLALAAIDLRRKPRWRLCEQGAERCGDSGVIKTIFWRDVPNLKIVIAQRAGVERGWHLRGNGCRIRVPNMDAARRGHALWQRARVLPA